MTIDSLIESITSIFEACMDWVTIVVDKISNTPLLLLCFVTPFVGLGIGLLKRLFTSSKSD